jgi:exodeoxyribonuclease VII large subunit
MAEDLILSVSDFVAYANQTLEYAYPSVIITGELANFRVSKNKWVYFDLKDEQASLRFFGTVYNLRGPLEDGMLLKVRGMPRLHAQYGFSITIQQIELVGEGTIRRASELLMAKLASEGLFDSSRKRTLPYPPATIGLITSTESAAYADFTKIINARWGGIEITVNDVQVQGVNAPPQIVQAVNRFNQQPEPPEVLVIIRGGGSAEDLQAFSEESVVRAVAASRIPTLVAIGHEIDTSLAELAADVRASTPSNAAELMVPDKTHMLAVLSGYQQTLQQALRGPIERQTQILERYQTQLSHTAKVLLERATASVEFRRELLAAYNPQLALKRGYAMVSKDNEVLRAGKGLKTGDIVDIEMSDVILTASVEKLHKK